MRRPPNRVEFQSGKGGAIHDTQTAVAHEGGKQLTRQDALGRLGECVMSMYGIARSLEIRDLGPAQLLPAIDDFRAHTSEGCSTVFSLLEELNEGASAQGLVVQVELLDREVRRVFAEVDELFDAARKLSARERLDLERNIDRVGGELQACHRLLGVMMATLSPRPIPLSISDLMRGRWAPQPAFVARRVEVCVKATGGARFEADPQVAWAIFERYIFELPESMPMLLARVDGAPGATPVLCFGDIEGSMTDSQLHTNIELGPRLAIERELLDAIVAHFGWKGGAERGAAQIAFAAG